MFYRLGKSGVGHQSGVVQCSSVSVLLALTEGMGGLFECIYTHFLTVGNLVIF